MMQRKNVSEAIKKLYVEIVHHEKQLLAPGTFVGEKHSSA